MRCFIAMPFTVPGRYWLVTLSRFLWLNTTSTMYGVAQYLIPSREDVDCSCNMIQVRRQLVGGIREFMSLTMDYCCGTVGPSAGKLIRRCEALGTISCVHVELKHIDVRHNFLRDLVFRGEFAIDHVPTEEQHTDFLTQSLSSETFALTGTWRKIDWFLSWENLSWFQTGKSIWVDFSDVAFTWRWVMDFEGFDIFQLNLRLVWLVILFLESGPWF